MEINTFLKLYQKRSGAVLAIILIFLVIGAAFTFSQSLKYRSKSRLLIVQNISADPYTVSKSNQYLSGLFSEIIYSGSFFDLMTSNSQFNVDKNYFSGNYKKQMETWKKTVEAKSVGDSGIMEISVYHKDPAQAKQISLAINNTLMTQSFNYQGESQSQAEFNVIDQPIVSDYPVKPNVVANLLSALVFGFIFSLLYIYLFPNTKKVKINNVQTSNIMSNYQASIKIEDKPNTNYEKVTLKEEYYTPRQNDYVPNNLPSEELEEEGISEFSFQGNIGNILK